MSNYLITSDLFYTPLFVRVYEHYKTIVLPCTSNLGGVALTSTVLYESKRLMSNDNTRRYPFLEYLILLHITFHEMVSQGRVYSYVKY